MKNPPAHSPPPGTSRVLLLNPPGKKPYLRDYYCSSVSKSGYYWHPIDLVVLSGLLSLPGQEFSLHVLDAIAEGLTLEAAFERAFRREPETVVFLTSAASWPEDRQFLQRLAGATGARMIGCGEIFLGVSGPLFAENPWLEAGILDFSDPGIPGYLESFLPCKAILTREQGIRKPGVGMPSETDRTRKPLARLRAADPGRGPGTAAPCEPKTRRRAAATFSCGIPRHELFPLDRYSYPWNCYHPFVSVLTAYGCPFACRFCNSGNLGFKLRETRELHAELCRVRELGIRQVFVKDMSFGADREHAREFCRLLWGEGFCFSWNCYVRLDSLAPALLEEMARCGCGLIQMGLETANPEVARRMGKSLDRTKAGEVFRHARRLGIRTGAHFVLGLPGETEQGIRETVALARELNPDYCSFNLFIPRYGSSLGGLTGDAVGGSQEAGDGSEGAFVPRVPGGSGCRERVTGVLRAGAAAPREPRRRDYEARDPVALQAGGSPGPRRPGPELDPSEAFPFASFCALDPGSLFRWRTRAYLSFYLRPAYLFRLVLGVRTRSELRGSIRNGWGLAKNLVRFSGGYLREESKRRRGSGAVWKAH